ncbi:MAG: WYL domain-containing protein [Candidatus Limisoma sp.]
MANNLLTKYIWLLETIQRFGRITRGEISELWASSPYGDGQKMPRRTFYNYREAIEELFGIRIGYNSSTFEYYIESDTTGTDLGDWLINSMSVNNMLTDAADVSNRIMVEDVPSARQFLPTIIDAMKKSLRIEFHYQPFEVGKSRKKIILEPYFLRLFRQRWYVIGYNNTDHKIKTYSLDRVKIVTILDRPFTMPDIDVHEFFKDCFGITTSRGNAQHVLLKVEATQAKYLRALPLHSSQQEQICDGYSIFTYKVHLTYDFQQQIMSMGDKVEVVGPPQLRTMVRTSLENSLAKYVDYFKPAPEPESEPESEEPVEQPDSTTEPDDTVKIR